ncbi:MAG: FTR1 family protein [Ardenticatenaceae bacterium]|nr:FTR1 family protein [Ardenticatenaceae bacterium]
MIASFLLALREGLEAALIVGLTIGVLTKMNRREQVPAVWAGVGVATAVSVGAAIILQLVGAELEGAAEQIFEGVTMFLASAVLTWMIFWMARQGRRVQDELQTDVKTALARGGRWGLFAIAFFAVVREGIETALFLTAAAMTSSAQQVLIGGLAGLAGAAVLGWLLFATAVRLNVRRFFQVTSVLLILFAAGLMAHGIHEFNEAGLIPSIIEHVWDMNHILDENSAVGVTLKALFGYNGNPSLTEILGYVAYYVAIFLGLRQAERRTTAVVREPAVS